MAQQVSRLSGPWVEPAHPGIVKLLDDLVSIYGTIREHYQSKIDAAFDEVSRQIGYVVTTSVPAVLKIDGKGHAAGIAIGADHLKGTLFDRELSRVLSDPVPVPWRVAEGAYNIQLIWFDALGVRLRTDWMEPAHYVRPRLAAEVTTRTAAVRPEVMEPAHWFDASQAIAVEEVVLVDALDRVYPELRLADRVAFARRQIQPGVKEPAHFRQADLAGTGEAATKILTELASVLRRYGY